MTAVAAPNMPRLRDLPVEDRLGALGLSEQEVAEMRAGLSLSMANHMSENVVGLHALPLGIAENFLINGRDVRVPMVTEEPSVIAACGYGARLVRSGGGFVATSTESLMIGQIQVVDVPNMPRAFELLTNARDGLIARLNDDGRSTNRGHGRVVDLTWREVALADDTGSLSLESGPRTGSLAFLIVHVHLDCGDAMGANMVNTVCEAVAPEIARLTAGRVNLGILSNYCVDRRARAHCIVPAAALQSKPGSNQPTGLVKRIEEASLFAENDTYRAVTHNKGVMNGIDAVTLATGNDWRAVEAAAHAWAARSGVYRSLTRWRARKNGDLAGEIEVPIAVGIVGGATKVHPTAHFSLKLLKVSTARQLAEIAVCVGLAQNLAALRALCDEGIQPGHMALHARQVAMAAGARGDEINLIADQMISEKNIKPGRAEQLRTGLAARMS